MGWGTSILFSGHSGGEAAVGTRKERRLWALGRRGGSGHSEGEAAAAVGTREKRQAFKD